MMNNVIDAAVIIKLCVIITVINVIIFIDPGLNSHILTGLWHNLILDAFIQV